ncbi:RusA family crossover junction endodeoxyribonuclease, partial [Enterococcus faecium]|uniref:RusA family crossover junction endodeoxyribonuclease n=1 Tax=Enterococcus faecium TaxID=1352 RepID=UPI003DA094E9
MAFYFARPKGHYRMGSNSHLIRASAPVLHDQAPDLDKLVRLLADAMSEIVYHDDRQIQSIWATKRWTESQSRASVIVAQLDGDG